MKAEFGFVRGDEAPLMEPEALASAIRNAGMPCTITKREVEIADIVLENGTTLLLTLDDGCVDGFWINVSDVADLPRMAAPGAVAEKLGWKIDEVGTL